MYKLVFECEKLKIKGTIELKKPEDIYEKCSIYQEVEEYPLANLINQTEFGINIFKPVPKINDFISIYSSTIFWNYFTPNLNEYLIGRPLKQLLPKFKSFKSFKLIEQLFKNNKRMDALLKLYENNELIKVWSQSNIPEKGYMYCLMKDETDYYIEKEKEEKIFKYSPLPLMNINHKCEIININKSFKEFTGFTLKDLNSNFFKENITQYNTTNKTIKNFQEAIIKIFNKTILYNDSKLCLKDKNANITWVNAHLRLMNKDLVQVSFQDLTQLLESQHNTENLNQTLSNIEETSKTAYYKRDKNGFHWTDEIFHLIEISTENNHNTQENIMMEYIYPEDLKMVNNILNSLSIDNPLTIKYRILTPTGKTKYFKNYILLQEEYGEIVKNGFITDITEKKVANYEAESLKKSLDEIQNFSKIFITRIEGGKSFYTDGVYDLLGVSREDYPPETLINFMVPEDREKLFQLFNSLTPENSTFKFKYKAIRPDGEPIYVSTYNKGTFNNNGDLLSIDAFEQDVTEETLAQEELVRLKQSIDEIQDFSKIFIARVEGDNYYYTDEVYHVLDIDPEKYPPNSLIDFMIPEDREKLMKHFNDLSPEEPVFKMKYTSIKPNGETIYVSTYNKGTFDENGKLIRIDAFEQDVTEETIINMEAQRLADNFSVIQETGKIFIAEYENGEYSYTSNVYDILGIKQKQYNKNESLINKFIIPEDEYLRFEFMDLTPENSVKIGVYRIKNSQGEIKYLNCTNKAIFNDKGELIRIVGLVQDVTEEELAKIDSTRLGDNFEVIQESGKIFLCIYENDEFFWTSEIYNVLGIKAEDYDEKSDILEQFILPEDLKHRTESFNSLTPYKPGLNFTLKVKRPDDEIRYLDVVNKAKFDENNEMVRLVALFRDITEETLAKQSALELQHSLEIIQSTSKIVIAQLRNGKFTWTSEIYNILEISPEDYPENQDLIQLFVLPGNENDFKEKVKELSPDNLNMHKITTIKTVNGNIKYLEGFFEAKFDDNGELVELISFINEITDRIKREKELAKLSEDRKILLQEVHHRVKNNLQIILSFLNIESRFNRDNPEYVIEQTRNRIQTMALTHEEVYQSPSVSKVNLNSFLTTGMDNLFNLYTHGNINLHFDVDSIEIDVDKAIPLGLLVNEVALNTIKYAFPETGKGDFYINLEQSNDTIVLKIWDNGIGLPKGFDVFNSNSLGFIIIRNLTQQLDAELVILDDISGFGVELIIPY